MALVTELRMNGIYLPMSPIQALSCAGVLVCTHDKDRSLFKAATLLTNTAYPRGYRTVLYVA